MHLGLKTHSCVVRERAVSSPSVFQPPNIEQSCTATRAAARNRATSCRGAGRALNMESLPAGSVHLGHNSSNWSPRAGGFVGISGEGDEGTPEWVDGGDRRCQCSRASEPAVRCTIHEPVVRLPSVCVGECADWFGKSNQAVAKNIRVISLRTLVRSGTFTGPGKRGRYGTNRQGRGQRAP